MILEGELAPGSRIAEREMCDAFGISRTPLREALKVLRTQLERARLYTFAASQIDVDEAWLNERIERADRELMDLTAIVNRLRAYP